MTGDSPGVDDVRSPETAVAQKEECRNCGGLTRQRVEGIPYCSSSCIGGRRKEKRMEHYECPYPDCEFSREWDPEISLAAAKASVDIELHRRDHGQEPEWSQ